MEWSQVCMEVSHRAGGAYSPQLCKSWARLLWQIAPRTARAPQPEWLEEWRRQLRERVPSGPFARHERRQAARQRSAGAADEARAYLSAHPTFVGGRPLGNIGGGH